MVNLWEFESEIFHKFLHGVSWRLIFPVDEDLYGGSIPFLHHSSLLQGILFCEAGKSWSSHVSAQMFLQLIDAEH